MNKYKEAMKIFERYVDDEWYKERFQNACKLAIELLEKATPKNSVENILNVFECPNCGNLIEEEFEGLAGCPYCLQAIDWSEE